MPQCYECANSETLISEEYMPETESSNWQRASLIPTSGLKGHREQEVRATSATLAVLSAVPEFPKSVLKQFGAPAGKSETFVEVSFKTSDGRMVRPDGLIRVKSRSRTWTCLVEVKTGRNSLEFEQLETYLDIARANGFDALVTFSNQFSPSAGVHPVKETTKCRHVSHVMDSLDHLSGYPT
jgi:hypothetical protein